GRLGRGGAHRVRPDRHHGRHPPRRHRPLQAVDAPLEHVAELLPLRARQRVLRQRNRPEHLVPLGVVREPAAVKSLAALRHWARTSDHPAAAGVRRARGFGRGLTLPAPRILVRPYLWLFLAARGTVFFLRRILVAEPLFKAYCTRVGRGVTTGVHVPWIQGSGELVVGDHVRISGKISVSYAASFTSRPRLEIGDHSDIAHDTRFVVGRGIRIGRYVQVAGGVTFRDSGGHPTDAEQRRLGGA